MLSCRSNCLIAALLMFACAPSFGAESQARDPCSGSAFLASNYHWFGVPVMRNAAQPAGDQARCLYVVPVSVALTEEWHLKKFAEEGWESTKRTRAESEVELEFRNLDRIVRVVISDLDFATAVLVKRPTLAADTSAE